MGIEEMKNYKLYGESVEELAESLADAIGIYGCTDGFDDHLDSCNCRICFIERMKKRIVQAVQNDVFLSNTKEKL